MTSKKNKVKVIIGPKDAKTESKNLQSSADTCRNQTVDNSKVLMNLQKTIPEKGISKKLYISPAFIMVIKQLIIF